MNCYSPTLVYSVCIGLALVGCGPSSSGENDETALLDARSPTPARDASAGQQDGSRPAGDAAIQSDPISGASLDAGRVDPLTSSTCDSSVLKAGKSAFTVNVDGMDRTFNLYVPSTYSGKSALPLILDFHGLGEGAALHELVSNWDDHVDQDNFIVAMPQGVGNAWNVGPCCTESRTLDDVKFARTLVAEVQKQGCIDPKRIYATGYSNGGGMTIKVACDAADLFAAVAPAAFDLLKEMDCKPSRPVSFFDFRGTSDPIVPYAGGPSTPPTIGYSLAPITFEGAVGTFERWSVLAGCTDSPVESSDGCQTHTQCTSGVKVALCTKQGGSHEPSDAALAWPMLKAYVLP